jgi:hypothetical protein
MKRYLFSVLAVLVAASAFALAAQAAPISPVSPLKPFGHPLLNANACTSLFNGYMTDVGEAVSLVAAGLPIASKGYTDDANNLYSEAKAGGCSWAS